MPESAGRPESEQCPIQRFMHLDGAVPRPYALGAVTGRLRDETPPLQAELAARIARPDPRRLRILRGCPKSSIQSEFVALASSSRRPNRKRRCEGVSCTVTVALDRTDVLRI